MQIDINTTTYSIKQRILAFFMAFMIFSLTCPEIFEGLGVGLIVHATNSPIDIHSDVKDGSVMQGTTSGIYTYTGKFTKAAVSMFDYVSDEEINGTVVESHTNSYNNIWHNIPNGGYDDAFSKLNKKISVSDITAGTGNSLTIRYRKSNVSGTEGGNEPYHNVTGYVAVYIFGGDTGELWSWNTAKTSHKMTYRSQFDDYEYVLDLSNSKFDNNKKAGNIIFIFEDGNQTEDLTLNVGRSDCGKYYNYTYQNWSNNTKVNATCEVENGISLYSIPLYFGTFYNGNNYLRDNNSQIMYDYRGGSKPGSVSQYTSSNSNYRKYNMVSGIKDEHDNYGNDITIRRKNFYNNFWWRANIGLKPQGTTADLNNSVARGNASVQGLVGQTLSGGNLTDPIDSSIVLPYLNETWSKSNSDVVKYYNADSNGGGVINFPFYEVKAAASGNVGNSSSSNIQGTYDGNYYGTGTSTTQYARFYQFDSSESNLYFHTYVTNNKGYFSETTTPIKSNLDNVGFFPFNSSNSSYGKANNRGFGAKYEMQFKLKNDGCVGVVDSSGNDLDPSEYKTRIDTIFDFVGDDDLWVFVDGTLILDMGGSHNKSAGSINFKTKQATVKRAVSIGSSDSDKDNLDVDGVKTTDSITTKLQTANSKTFVDNDPSKGYNENTTHTMTIFYMERGMNDSNLKIRFNYSPEANFSKMKITEYTDFSGVNDGLVSYTKKAAEDDIFKYTVSNKNTSKSDIYNSSAKYPTAEASIRTNEADSNLTTKLVNGSSQTQTISNFNPPGTLNTTTGIWSKVNEFKRVSGTSYLWVDGFANNKKMVGITTGSNASNTTGDGDSGGELYLMYGTNNDIYNSKAEGQESSAEFEKQFSKNSTMLVLQDSNLYSPKRMDGSTPVSPGLISNTNGNLFSALTDNGRDVADYYTTTVRLVDREFAENKTLVNDGVNDSANNTLNNGGQFLFANDPNGSSADLPVMLTEYFTNAVNTNTLEIKKVVSGTAPAGTTGYNFTLQLKDVFGTDVSVSDYSGIKAKKTGDTTAQTYINSSGNFILTAGESLTIEGIPYGTKYKITETNPNDGATITYSTVTTDGNGFATLTADKTGNNAFTVTNTYPSETGVDVLKKNGNGDGLPGAEFELWYKETITPPTYAFNEPKLVPNQLNTMKVTATPSELGVPGLEIPESITTYKFKTTYTAPEVPDVSDKDWILPRNDTDYIYFRDYNVGDITGWEDSASFNDTSKSNANTNNDDGKRSWRGTEFATHTGHSQNLELFFDDNDTYWMAAEFSRTGKKTIKYAMWERFVDKYDKDSNGTEDVVTTVWKIQPPDGYTNVKFMMLSGDTVIRETQSIPYELGKIYHKTSWGKWTKRNNIDSYYDVPVETEGYWAPNSTANDAITDSRMSYTTYDGKMLQARKYEPTAQKVIFHCNSTNVWHNIHIEFFTDSSGTPVNGQAFPGYMMEPYAYAGDDYRMSDGYLTYELTIPATAKYFSINNGKEGGTYSYMTAITALNDGSANATGKGKKNYGNYWQIDTEDYANNSVTLKQWTPQKEENGTTNAIPAKDYKNAEVTSDYDYIYFKKPITWTGENVYAYFYAGGNLRDDNWQRACYSSWPGVAPAGTEYGSVHSNTYSIKTTDNTYNGRTTTGDLSPETTISNGTIYKFRIPKGDRTNYSKVIFNNGLTAVSGGDETGVIEYQPGHIYTEKGKATKHYENSPTVLYEASKVDDTTEYIYVKNTAGWDDLHITFYDANGGQILQQGKGYVMDYADTGANTGYFKIPLPTDAAKFSVNNGIGSANASKVSPKADIVRLNADGTVKATPAASDKFVYELTSNGDVKLTRSTINTQKEVEKTQPTPQEEGFTGYTMIDNPQSSGDNKANPEQIPQVRQTTKNGITTDDTLNIRDMANWDAKIGQISVTFYTSDNETIGPNVMLKTVADSQNKKWYTKKIPNFSSNPVNAFTVTYIKNDNTYTTPKYPIYPSVPTDGSDGQERTESGCMFFDTQGSGTASTLVMTNVEPAKIGNEVDDETYPKRGDYLYIVNTQNALPLSITFYASGTNVIKSGVKTKYINNVKVSEGNYEYWSKVSIPEGAQSFTIAEESPATQHPIYELKSKVSWYEKDYTLGDMQYTFNGTTATCVYPVFTPTPVNELEISAGHTLTSKVAVLVDEDAIASYQGAAAKLPTTTGGESPAKEILYNTANDNVTYSWTEGSGTTTEPVDNYIWFDDSPTGWGNSSHNNIRIKFFNSASEASDTDGTMSYNSTKEKYYYTVPDGNYRTVEIWQSGSNTTKYVTLSNQLNASNYYGKSCTVTPTVTSGASGYLWYHLQLGDGTHNNMKAYFYNSSSGAWTESGNDGGQQTVNISGTNHNFWKFPIPSNVSNYNRVVLWNDQTDYKYFTKSSSDYYISLTNTNSYGSGMVLDGTGTYSSYNDWAGEYNYYGCICKNPRVYVSDNIRDVINNDNAYVQWRQVSIATSTYASYLGTTTYSASIGSPVTQQVGSSTTYTYSYQPEDRYGMISDQNSTTPVTAGYADVNDFIYIVVDSSLTDPYINFLDSSDNQIGTYSAASAKGIPLKYTGYTGAGTTANPYKIRLPKDAAKFTISNSSTTGTAQLITESSLKAKIGTAQQEITLPNDYYHAGTTFYINSSCEVDADKNNDGFTDGKKLRTGFTPYKTETMADPLQPMSDADFVFFTDTDGTFANSNKVYAYFYGDVDGEYKAWPGTMATSATSTSAATTYTNNNGKTVYKFRIPKDDDGIYSKVIFTDGQASPKITAAQDIRGGRNYILGSDNSETYGSMTSDVFAVTTKDKTASPSTVNYNSSDNRTIYIINNGTTCNAAGETDRTAGDRYILDDMHVEFFNADGSTHVGTPEGYIPEKVGTHADDTVYRITVPSNAKFFRINNGNGKDNVTDNHNHTRNSEIKPITANGLYKFVTDEKYTKDGSNPTTVAALSSPEYLLTLTNKIDIDGDAPTSETYDVHLATIKTGSDGNTSEILWVKDDLDYVDTEYLVDNSSIPVKVKKQGTYYWKEVTPPSGYKLSTNNKVEFTLPANNYQPAEFTNPPIETGSLTIKKKIHSVADDEANSTYANTAETDKLFTFTIELNAPVGTVWSQFTTNSVTWINQGSTGATLVSDNGASTASLNRVITVKLPANNSTTVTIGNIPYGTTYNITETAPTTDYSSTPIEIKYQNNTIVEEMKGTVNATTTSYLVTDKHEVGSLNLKDVVIDRGKNALYYAGVNQPKTSGGVEYIDYTKYDYYVILEAPEGIELKDYISMDDLTEIIGFKNGDVNKPDTPYVEYFDSTGTRTTSTSASRAALGLISDVIGVTASPGKSTYKFHIDVTSSVDGAKTISNIPIGTKYSVVEVDPTATYHGIEGSATSTDYTGAGASWFGTAGVLANDPGTITLNYQDAKNNNSPTVTITNYYRHPTASISLEKALPDGDNDSEHQNKVFSFTIDLDIDGFNNSHTSDPAITLAASDLAYTYTPANANANGASASFANNKIFVTLKPGQKVKIDGIPSGIKYKVTETTNDFGWSSKYTINGGSEQDGPATSGNDTTNISTEQAVKFTNTYGGCSLTVAKTVENRPSGLNTDNPNYTFKVTLTNTDSSKGLAYNKLSFVKSVNSIAVSEAEDVTDGFHFTVTMKSGQNLQINGIPDGTQYTVEETSSKDGIKEVDVQVDSGGFVKKTDYKSNIATLNSSSNASDTVTFKNVYPETKTLKLEKEVKGELPASLGSNPKFKFHVVLTQPNSPTGVDLTKYPLTYTIGTATTTYDITKTTNTTSSAEFDVYVEAGSANYVTISGIPDGAKYTVTEQKDKYSQKGNDSTYSEQSIPTAVNFRTDNISYSVANIDTQPQTIQSNNDSNYVKVTNTFFGNLVLKKKHAGSLPTGKVDDTESYTFKVTLSNLPTGTTLTGANPTYTIKKSTTTNSVTTTSNITDIENDNSFTVSVSKGTPVTISGIPYGTQYTVVEQNKDTNHVSANGEISTASSSYKISETDSEVEITNTYVGKLILSKSLLAQDGVTYTSEENSKTFTYHVKLSNGNSDVDLTSYITRFPETGELSTITQIGGQTVSSVTAYEAHNIEFDIAVASNTPEDNRTFSNIPHGTSYTVTETQESSWTTVASSNTSGSINATSDTTASFTNAKTGTLVLEKDLATGTDADKDASGNTTGTLNKNQQFTYTVVLTEPTGIDLRKCGISAKRRNAGDTADETVTLSHTYDSSVNPHTYTFTVDVSKARPVTISNIPNKTGYTVTEAVTGKWIQTAKSGDDSTISAGTTSTATFTNALTGELDITKTIAAYGGADVPSGTFGFTVTFSDLPSSGYQLKKDGTNISLSDNSYTFDFAVTNSESPKTTKITGIPFGTTYTVTETTIPKNWIKTSPTANPTGTISSTVANMYQAAFTNTYTPVGSLQITKTLDNSIVGKTSVTNPTNQMIGDTTHFKVKVTINAPNGHNWSEYNALTIPTGGTGDVVTKVNAECTDSTVVYTMDIWEANGGSKTIGNIPYNATYSIEEIDLPTFSDGSCFVEGQKTNESFTTVNSTKTETIKNSYVQKGSLTLKKTFATTAGSADISATEGETPVYPSSATIQVDLKKSDNQAWTSTDTTAFAAYIADVTLLTSSKIVDDVATDDNLIYSLQFTLSRDNNATQISKLVLKDVPLGVYKFKVTEPDVPMVTEYDGKASISNNADTTYTSIASGALNHTITVTNTYTQLSNLTLNKNFMGSLPTGTNAVTNETNFRFKVTLYPLNGVHFQGTNKNFTIKNGASEIIVDSNNSFEVLVSKNTPVTISGIPAGTKYAVEEVQRETNSTELNNVKKFGEIPATAETKPAISATEDNSVTITNSYVKNIDITKQLKGNYGYYGVKTTDTFEFEVTLTPPEEMSLAYFANNYLGQTGVTTDNLKTHAYTDNLSVVLNGEGTPVAFKKTVSTTAESGHKATILGIPYGTKYTVSEKAASHANAEKVEYQLNDGTFFENFNEGSAKTVESYINNRVTVKNTYYGTLKLNKTLSEYTPYNVTSSKQFTFNVTLTKEGLTKVKVDGVERTITSGTAFPVLVSKDHSVVISDIPIGTEYLVTEADSEPAPTVEGNMTSTVEITEDSAAKEVIIKNAYTKQSKKITLFKRDVDNNGAIEGATFVLLKLNSSADATSETVVNAFKNADEYTALSSYYESFVDNLTTGDDGTVTVTIDADNAHEGDSYFFYEVSVPEDSGYVRDNTLTDEKIITLNDYQDEYTAIYDNKKPTSTDVEIEKQDKITNEPLGGAIFNLWYEEVTIPTKYNPNEPFSTPSPLKTTVINGNPNVPAVVTPPPETTVTTYKYEYKSETVPSVEEKDWILPRTDNDYIYFRDYNDATKQANGSTPGYIGTQDKQSFNENNNKPRPQNANRSWIWTSYEKNVFGQEQEIKYDHQYWVAAQFSAPGKKTVQYAVWERFLDKYTTGEDTVIWKIQPPDGYTKVRFLLYKGDNCIRTTNEFTFKLGEIYHKTSYGTWKMEHGNECYFDAPVKIEGVWSTYNTNNNNSSTGQKDKRQSGSVIEQADRYTPTEQKIVFHCNSTVVWHNIHIEFFGADGTTPVGQKSPGYMMEPYAYAGSDYRINGYLTYELTIPAEAKYFRVNNGVTMSTAGYNNDYGFYSNITALKHIEGRKNYGNYFKIESTQRAMTNQPIDLVEWTSYTSTGDSWAESYSTTEVDSDYDYIYFEKPSDWNGHVYAYFYGGGDLRKDNWQRATYSVWPGVAPVATEYKEGSTEHHSDTYDYSYTGNLYDKYTDDGGTATKDSSLNPESTIGTTIYKFRIPKGDRKNYSKVIFNDGLSSQSGKHETGVIEYKAGYLYNANGSSPTKHYENKPTASYTKRGNGDDYIYIKVPSTIATTWNDMHITFYDSNNTQILQKGDGYVMDYSGTQTETVSVEDAEVDVNYTYYRAAIPTNASKFALNNGYESTIKTENGVYYDILRLEPAGDESASDYTKDRMVFTMSGSGTSGSPYKLSLTAPTFTPKKVGGDTTISAQEDYVDYTVRQSNSSDDTLYILNDAPWNDLGVGKVKVKFYDENGNLITGDGSEGNGTYTMLETSADSNNNNKFWYTIGIPTDAKTFTVSYTNGTTVVTTPEYDIYPYGDSNSTGSYTATGNMYYKTETGGKLSLIEDTIDTSGNYTEPTYETTEGKRGDYLYLVCAEADKSTWDGMKVIFYHDGTAMTGETDVDVQYLNYVSYDSLNPVAGVSTSDENAVGHWFRVAIPKGTKNSQNEILGPTSFTVTKDGNSASGEIYRLDTAPSRYANDYTTGDMQYRLPSGTGTVTPTLLYPIFTEEEVQSVEIGGQTIYSQDTISQADASQVDKFAQSEIAKLPTPDGTTSQTPVLYQTDTDTVKYSWGSSASDTIWFDNTTVKWSEVWAVIAGGTPVKMTADDTNSPPHTFSLDVSSYTADASIVFQNAQNYNASSGHKKTGSGITLQKGKTFKASTANYLYVLGYDTFNTNLTAFWSSSDSSSWASNYLYDNAARQQQSNSTVSVTTSAGTTYTSVKKFYIPVNETTNEGIAHHNISSTSVWLRIGYDGAYTPALDISNTNYGAGHLYMAYEDGGSGGSKTLVHVADLGGDVYTGTWSTTQGTTQGGSVTYQPEDRYGYIDDVTGFTDKNNFIYINTTLDDMTIHFYSGTNGTGNITGATSDISLNYNKVNDTTVTKPTSDSYKYLIRLPRNAKSFTLTAGGKTVTQNLEENVSYTTAGGESITLNDYHHAGTTFTIIEETNNLKVSNKKLREGFTVSRDTVLEEPLNPKTDADYVFFTDTTGSFADSGTVYAYFYGDVDGEFKAWPGIKATTPTATNTVATTYTNSDGKTVYKFRIPQGDNGKYKKVIFTDGVNDSSTRKITKAMDIEHGKNYVLGALMQTEDTTPANIKYGTFSKNVYDVTTKAKAGDATQYYSTSGDNYIYIINNGTQDTTTSTTPRTTLDEMHVTFYDANGNIIGSKNAGYIPDLLTEKYDTNKDVYRIQLPPNASTFQINNGINKGTSKERYSVKEKAVPNGLYQFVESTDSNKLVKEGTTFNTSNLNQNQYMLTLVNKLSYGDDVIPISTTPVWLAKVESDDTEGSNLGKIKCIKDLKAEGIDGGVVDHTDLGVDTEYLNHTKDDINNEDIHQVKVVKKGKYYWKETKAPDDYTLNETHLVFEYKDDGVYYYDENGNPVKVGENGAKMVIQNEPKPTEPEPENPTEVIFTKTAKEKVGTTDIGDVLEGAEFQLVNADDTSSEIKFTLTTPDSEDDNTKKTNVYTVSTSGTYNVSSTSTWLATGEDGRLHIKGLANGNYYLEEKKAPNGFSNKDSNSVVDGVVQNKKVYFSIGKNTPVKEISASDEMEPAYIKLYEHINMKKDAWGDPTFIFKIKQTGYYKNDGTTDIQTIDNGKEILVALTVDDNNKITNVVKWFNPNGINFDEDKINNSTYGNWLVEGTTDLADYQGIFDIDSKGRIRVEPGSYEITRVPVSRYEFVTNGKTGAYANDNEPGTWTEYKVNNAKSEKLTIDALPKGYTIDVHYYDQVAYYDKFSQVDEKINTFYTIDSDKANKTIKGIRIEDYKVDTVSNTDMDTLVGNTLTTMNLQQSPRFKAYYVYADGTEAQITTQAEFAKLSISYEYVDGSEDKTSFATDFSYDKDQRKIQVDNYSNYQNGVYTLKATYDNKFTTNFDIVFERTSS